MVFCPRQDLEYIINHVVLPPRLPQEAESTVDTASAEQSLLDLVLSTVRHFLPRCAPGLRAPWLVVEEMLLRWIATKPHGDMLEQLLEQAIARLKPGDVLPIRIHAQNAALILRHIETAISIECFELSSLSAEVMGCKGNLRRKFPAHGLSIPLDVATDTNFRRELCTMLGRLALETVDEMMPKSKKAGSARTEVRDTCHPGLVTEMLMASLAAVGTPHKVLQVQKRIRDDVLWDSCLLPWRRSSLWLVVRISIQTTLARNMDPREAATQYKNFMVLFLADILAMASRSRMGADLCKMIQMKMARRAAKLSSTILPFVEEATLEVAVKLFQSQNEEWQELQRKDAERETKISLTTVEEDTVLTLHNSRPALDHAMREIEHNSQPVVPIPSISHEWVTIPSDGFPVMASHMQNTEEEIYALAEYEEWVWNSLPSWLEKALAQPCATQCTAITSSGSTYKSVALKTYAGCAEQLSLMFLAMGELWRALDTIAGQLTPLLHQYSPEISSSVFHTLLLSKRVHMQRLHDLESHINQRHHDTRYANSSIFADPSVSHVDCFAYQYYDQSISHRELYRRIVADADKKRDEKRREWQQGTDRYNDLKRQHDALSQCDTTVDEYGVERHNASTCRRCDLKRSINQMGISIFEWPLPNDEVSYRLVVFELHCPTVFVAWRNFTWMVIHDLGRPRDTLGQPPHEHLNGYAGLSSYHEHTSSRIVLAASTKSINASHYGQISFPVELEEVCSDHGPQWQYHDKSRGLWLRDQVEKPSYASKGETVLPEGPYRNLQWAVNSTMHGQNEVLAAQSDCSSELNLHEHLAYGSLRADGERTQWLNICRELQASNLSWNTEAVCTLVRQSAWQVGPASETYLRVSHSIFRIPEFRTKLLSNISKVITSIRANRQSVYTMSSLVALILRTLSLGGDEYASDTLCLLRECRTIIADWLSGLADSLRPMTNAKQILSIRRSLLRVALLCKFTFDVDIRHTSQVMTSSEDLRFWTTSSMIVQDNTPGAESGLPADLCRLLLCDRKLSHAHHRHVQHFFTSTINKGLDQAVLNTWSAFHSSDDLWKYHGATGSRWLCKTTLPGRHGASQMVYYNVLNGQLLVDGRPLGTLPKEYTTHSLFVRIFGAQILRVSASDMAGMLYMTANEEYGYKIYFVTRGADLIVRARNTSTVFEVIPHQCLDGDFPTIFVEDHVHWLDLSTGELEFRAVSQKWMSSDENWRLHYIPQGTSQLQKGEMRLVDIRSPTFKRTLAVFGGLERAEFVHAISSFNTTFEVLLPRLGFRFLMNSEAELECQELRKIVATDQSLGTLIGLKSRLVLCAKGDRSKSLDRTVLIPKGDVSVMRKESHLHVHIATTGRDVQCLRYQLNIILNRLDGDGSVISRLYQVYLHALTAYILPDPLTGKLGTEESLRLLSEQKSRCCKPLEAAEIDLLDVIAGLTPHRAFYPNHLRVMQQVSWHGSLSPLNQHSNLVRVAEELLGHAQQFSIFYFDSESPRALEPCGDPSLLQRARLRNATFQNVEYGGNERSVDYDEEYNARDGVRSIGQATRVFDISSLIVSWTRDLAVPPQRLADRWKSWGTVSGIGTTFNFSPSTFDLLNLAFPSSWAPLYEYCRHATRDDSRYKLLFLFSIIAYGSKISSLDDLKTLLAFATNPSLQALPPFPSYTSFTLERGSILDHGKLRGTITSCLKGWPGSRPGMTAAVRRQEQSDFQRVANSHVDTTTDLCARQWPCKVPSSIPSDHSRWIKTQEANNAVRNLFAEWYKNRECEQHMALIQNVLNAMTVTTRSPMYELTNWHQREVIPRNSCNQSLPTLGSLMASRSPILPNVPSMLRDKQHTKVPETSKDLRSLITNFALESNSYHAILRTEYKNDLLISLDAFQDHLENILPEVIPHYTKTRALDHFETCQKQCLMELDLLRGELQPQEPIFELLRIAGVWPRLQLCDLLSAISSVSPTELPLEWRDSIITLGIGITVMQRARRLVLAAEKSDVLSLYKEFGKQGRLHWTAHERPDWLLMEIENDLLVRPIQARVALEMIEPSNAANTLMQLNMGEGKSSVIVPLIATALANGQQLSRVIVLRSLTRQMQDTITQRLGGLAARPIYYMPFSRKTIMNETTIRHLKAMYVECMANGGILIAQPEHVLSFKLMGVERLVSAFHNGDDGEIALEPYTIATKLLDAQAWLTEHCRDVLDESDEILDVKFQLIYTLGAQRSMDGQPDRWFMMQGIFDLVERQACLLQELYPDKIEVNKHTSPSFPMIRLIGTEVRELLILRIVEDICESKVSGVAMSSLTADVKEAAAAFVNDKDVSETCCKVIQAQYADDELYLKKLLFLRGLVAGGILIHVLHEKRWSVNYGLHPMRCLCAVPYRAKGVPAATAEFGHPDVTIALTCLSYYYTGLTNAQLRTCLEILHKDDDPTAEYETWVKADGSFPRQLRHWNAVNLEDQQQCENLLFPALRFNKKVADSFLTNVVFPKEGKEFDQKLSTSGWDIPVRPGTMKVTTGFSGTNDNRFLLPCSISQRDLPELRHTSGKVLEFVSRPENLGYACAKDSKGAHLSSEELLAFIQHSDPNFRVLIDVGAQILDLANDQVIAKWLTLVPDADAGVYFDENDYAMVRTRSGKKEKLGTSSFSTRMDRCLVYLDDVHTRGTDLKLPITARAAITLGPRLTKDRLVQACMRLRQLGHGQSLMFVAPPEVHQEIASAASTAKVNGLDVIKWALEQSCLQIQRNQPLRVTQGLHYFQRIEIMEELNQHLRTMTATDNHSSLESPIEGVVEHEAQSLRDLYAPESMRDKEESGLIHSSRSKQDKDIQDLIEIWDQIDLKASQGAKMHEEHEREVAHEVEQETQVERPPRAEPLTRRLDPKIRNFIRSGTSSLVEGFSRVHKVVLESSAAAGLLKGQSHAWSHIRVSQDFFATVKRSKADPSDDYLRPVHWVLMSRDKAVQTVLLISQYEVNQLFETILDSSSRVALVCYEPRVTRTMPSLDASTYHPLPHARDAWDNLCKVTRQELHLFAGQLYFTKFDEYEQLTQYRGVLGSSYVLPLHFIKVWMGIRRKGQNYLQTHIGQVVGGRVLLREMFETGDGDDITTLYASVGT